jgi:hypothetical protein
MKKKIFSFIATISMVYMAWALVSVALAVPITAHPVIIHKAMGDGFTTVDNAYAIVTDLANADMYDSTGAVQTTYASAALAATADGQNTDWALLTVPALPAGKRYAITFYENASPAAGDTAIIGPVRYDPVTGETFTDTNPLQGSIIRVRQTAIGG